MCDRVGRKVGGGLLMQCWHEGLGTREPVVVVYAFVSSSIRAEPCSLVKVHALVDACRGRVQGLDKLAFAVRRSLSHDGSSVPLEGVAGTR